MTGSFSNTTALKDQFHKLDYRIMKHAFNIHNRMGNCHDEEVYQNELLHLIQNDAIQVQKEVPLPIEFRSFKKTYSIDLLIEGEHIYELKVLPKLANQCRSQIINYQLISEKSYGKLINFGTPSVEHEFSTTTLTKEDRLHFSTDHEECDPSEAFFSLAEDLFKEWGTRLDPALYSEALQFLLPSATEKRIDIISENRIIGHKLVRLATPQVAYKITTSKTPTPLGIQFQKFINHTNLAAMFWINLNRNQISFHTLEKK